MKSECCWGLQFLPSLCHLASVMEVLISSQLVSEADESLLLSITKLEETQSQRGGHYVLQSNTRSFPCLLFRATFHNEIAAGCEPSTLWQGNPASTDTWKWYSIEPLLTCRGRSVAFLRCLLSSACFLHVNKKKKRQILPPFFCSLFMPAHTVLMKLPSRCVSRIKHCHYIIINTCKWSPYLHRKGWKDRLLLSCSFIDLYTHTQD